MTADTSASGAHAAQPCSSDRYGLTAGSHPAIQAWAEQVDAILAQHDLDAVPDHVCEALKTLLAEPDLLRPSQQESRADWYRKHQLYADPAGRYTLLALVWLPGQGTDIHGHTAWGSVGVYRGQPNVVCYDCAEGDDGTHAVDETSDRQFGPGDLCAVRPGLGDVHRIYNATDETMITIHAYGLDLVEHPDAINLNLTLPA
ncbi:MAG: cysteine dioxygenase family protein [Planctomycetota bacterium]|nr:cysteine dioxygenase family protein [Planctomycetota bacterium]